ncbi:MAG TPA: monovalent cation:proton antiporter-2 (CPA2) family protein [Steroidobacteraceae bacterium]|nr:monovalent cation:proton antiporter-2 (CPA2) family protein [Steroidobacteraceae bacterium]
MRLAQIAIFLLAAVVFVPLFRWLKLSSILGYVAAGLVIGPWGLGLVTGVDRILQVSEFGVALLLFVIGLELQPSRLWVLRRAVFGVGSAQVALCTLLVGAAACLLGVNLLGAFVIGFGLALSSTALVLQVLAERGQLKSSYGRSAFGILLFQDLAVLPMLAALPLATHGSQPLAASLIALGKLVAVIGLVIVGGRVVLRPVLRLVANTRVTEVFTAATLLIVIGTALVMNAVGLSMSLGAFLAGVLLADSEFRHELEADIEPFKGLLLGLFFISVGMSANLGLLVREPGRLLGLTLGFMLLKFLAIALLGRLMHQPRGAAWRLGLSLVAGGEFAFVLFGLVARQGLLDADTADLLILAVTLSMVLGPLLLGAYDAVLHPLFAREDTRPYDEIEDREARVLIAGFGRFGQIVGRVLRAKHVPFTALDSSSANIDFIRRFGNQAYYGDASRLDMLRAAGAEQARVLVLAIDDVEASVRTAEIVLQHFPRLRLIARARNRQHAFRLMEIGVRDILRETYGSSLEAAQSVLEALGEPTAAARAAVKRFREHDEATLRRQFSVREDESKMIATTREATLQLESLFEADSEKASDQA